MNLREAMGSVDSDTLDALIAHREEMRQQREVRDTAAWDRIHNNWQKVAVQNFELGWYPPLLPLW